MWEFNVIVTAASGGIYRHLLQDLAPLGEFHRTEFLGVVAGRVAEPSAFLETLRSRRAASVIAFQDLGRVIPLEHAAVFRIASFPDVARELIAPFVNRLAGRRFHVRLERRGHKGEIVSPEAERALDTFLLDQLAQRGATGTIGFADPDAVVALETLGDRLGAGLLTREMFARYDFVRIG